jgi:hypothetical protein
MNSDRQVPACRTSSPMPANSNANAARPVPAGIDWPGALRASSPLTPAQARGLVAAVACAHLVGLWTLLQVAAVREAVHRVAPLMVDLVTPERPEPPQPAPPPPTPPLPALPRQQPQPTILAAPERAPDPAPAYTAPPPPEPPQAPVEATPAPAVQYLVLPPGGSAARLAPRRRARRGLAARGGRRARPARADPRAALFGPRAWTNRRCGPCARPASNRKPTTAPRSSSR